MAMSSCRPKPELIEVAPILANSSIMTQR